MWPSLSRFFEFCSPDGFLLRLRAILENGSDGKERAVTPGTPLELSYPRWLGQTGQVHA